jgi:predicted metal-dependent phosphoesterase TrpH
MHYAGLCVTNHFGGRKEQPWNERVELLYNAYKEALDEGESLSVDVFFGWEYSCSHAQDYLTYGLDERWLYAHPEIQDMTTCEYLDFARSSGGLIVHAHPFREDKIGTISLRPHHVDAVEVINTGRPDEVNRLAAQYAENYNLPRFAGSDTHSANKEKFAGICFSKRIAGIHDMIARFKNGEGELFCAD